MLDGSLGFRLDDISRPPLVHGVARLTSLLYSGHSYGDLLELIGPQPAEPLARSAWSMDRSWAYALNYCPYQSSESQREALGIHQVFRLRSQASGPRLLALAAPGDLMVNAPLDFIAEPAGLRLDLVYVTPSGSLPAALPDHDVAIVAASESAPEALAVFAHAFGAWPRPILNDPQRIAPMSRAWLPRQLAGMTGLLTAPAAQVTRDDLERLSPEDLLPGSSWPYLLRPAGSHAGHGLVRVDTAEDLRRYLVASEEAAFTLTQFIDYRGGNGWYCKYRIALLAGRPFICHMAASEHWMVHYLNAGMDGDAEKRAAEAASMAGFEHFARRHAEAFSALVQTIGLDYFSIDCAEAPDGRLLVFEADTAAIVHSMDPPDLYPYKRPAMQRCYDAFGAMVRARAAEPVA